MCSCAACMYVCSYMLSRNVLIIMPGNKILELSIKLGQLTETAPEPQPSRLPDFTRSSLLQIITELSYLAKIKYQ